MVKFASIASALFAATALVSARVVAPSDEARSLETTAETEAGVEKRDVYGSGTYFEIGLGACGYTNNDSQFVVAVSAQYFDTYPGATANPNNNPICGRQIWVWGWTGYSPQLATIVDRCAGCAGEYDIDMSPSLFEATIGALSIGRSPIGWNWA